MNRVLDACAMIAFLRDEPGAKVVEAILTDSSNQCFAHAISVSLTAAQTRGCRVLVVVSIKTKLSLTSPFQVPSLQLEVLQLV